MNQPIKVLVCAKRVVDANVKVRIKDDFSDVDIAHSKMSLNPFDENAIEAAVILKEQNKVAEIICVSIGSDKCSDTLRTALARGCDRAIHVNTSDRLDPIIIAKILKAIVAQENPQLIMLGKQAIDDDANQVGQMLAGMLNYPQGTFVSQIELVDEKVMVQREIENGTELLEIAIPAVLTADLHLNEPRFIKLPQLMQAKKKPLSTLTLQELGVEVKITSRIIKVSDGEIKKNCTFLNSPSEIINILAQKEVL